MKDELLFLTQISEVQQWAILKRDLSSDQEQTLGNLDENQQS